MMKINQRLLPIKAHYFFFMASMGPILPQLVVYGKQLGISTIIMGSVTGVLPIIFLLAKPVFGFFADRYRQHRKLIFISLVISMGVFYAGLYFVPAQELLEIRNVSCQDILDVPCNVTDLAEETKCQLLNCELICDTNNSYKYSAYPSTKEKMKTCSLINENRTCSFSNKCSLICGPEPEADIDCTLTSARFWIFVILLSAGTVGFNVINSISDAICFDVLGEGEQMAYGKQRVWGTIGFGLSALLSGIAVNWWSSGDVKSFTPAILIMIAFLSIDVFFCTKLQLPIIETPRNIIKDVCKLLRHVHIRIFIIFAAFAGIVDSFLVFFFFWYLEDLAILTGHQHNIKLLEGIIVAAETLGGEVIFFSVSGTILKQLGYGHSLSLCFINYALRLGLISLVPSPWWVVPIELCLQGPTYAMCYTTIVAYASAISPPGTSATMQGLVAGIDDGLGYAVGNIIAGLLYRLIGGREAVQVFCGIALMCGIVHFILYRTILEDKIPKTKDDTGVYMNPQDARNITENNVD